MKKERVTSLKKSITVHFVIIGGIGIALTTILTIFVYYSMFRRQIFDDLHTNAEIISSVLNEKTAEEEQKIFKNEGLRITVINDNGLVLYDSDADSLGMENHKKRPEVLEAFTDGEGHAVRHSSTLNQTTYYYAVRLSEHVVLRIAKKANGLFAVFYGTIPILLIGIAILFVVCLLMSHLLTSRIVKPIEKMASNLNQFEEFHKNVPYGELKPFANMIWIQHDSITKQLHKIEHSEQMRQEFTANVSHELKTPLTAITGYAELIESGITKQEDLQRFGSEIRKNATRLLHLMNDIIELSELDEKDFEVSKDIINLYDIAKKCTDNLMIFAKKHQVSLSLSGEPAFVYANKDMMEELINNLCDNAIRYNKPNGQVHVRVVNQDNSVSLNVEDTGIGIAKEHIGRVFERFYRVDKSRSKETGGTGLGLAIVKHIVAKHGEQLHLTSEIGVGTKIEIVLPIKEDK